MEEKSVEDLEEMLKKYDPDKLIDGFSVSSIWWAILFSVLLSILQSILHSLLKEDKK